MYPGVKDESGDQIFRSPPPLLLLIVPQTGRQTLVPNVVLSNRWSQTTGRTSERDVICLFKPKDYYSPPFPHSLPWTANACVCNNVTKKSKVQRKSSISRFLTPSSAPFEVRVRSGMCLLLRRRRLMQCSLSSSGVTESALLLARGSRQ